MSFLKKFVKKDPYEKLQQDFNEIKIKNKAINLFEELKGHDKKLVEKLVSEKLQKQLLVGSFVGKKGWFLPKSEEKLNDVWPKLKAGSIDLEKLGKKWGLNAKRCFLLLSEYAKKLNLKEPYFIRKNHIIFLRNYLHQIWFDEISTLSFDAEEDKFDEVIDRIKFSGEYKQMLKDEIINLLADNSSEIALGRDGILRRKTELDDNVAEYILQKWEEKYPELTYQEISSEFGLHPSEIAPKILKLVEEKMLPDTTNYPIDEILKPRI